MPLRAVRAWLIPIVPFLCPVLCLAADDSRPVCNSQNQGQLWPEAANHDPKLISRLVRCGELFICVRGAWHYHWESPTIRVDQLGRHAKSKVSSPPVCAVESAVTTPAPDRAAANEKLE
jgi:hypothetical protein